MKLWIYLICHSAFINLLYCVVFSINLVNVSGSYSQEKYNYLFEKYLRILLTLKWPYHVMPKDYLVLKCTSDNDRCIDIPLSILYFWNRVVYGFSLVSSRPPCLWPLLELFSTILSRLWIDIFIVFCLHCILLLWIAQFELHVNMRRYFTFSILFGTAFLLFHRETRITVASYSTFPLNIIHKVRNI